MIRVAVVGNTDCLPENFELVSKYEDFDVLLISYMPLKMLGECALGINEDLCRAFLKNKPVYVLKSGLVYKKIFDRDIFQLYCTYAQGLKRFGVKFIDSAEEICL